MGLIVPTPVIGFCFFETPGIRINEKAASQGEAGTSGEVRAVNKLIQVNKKKKTSLYLLAMMIYCVLLLLQNRSCSGFYPLSARLEAIRAFFTPVYKYSIPGKTSVCRPISLSCSPNAFPRTTIVEQRGIRFFSHFIALYHGTDANDGGAPGSFSSSPVEGMDAADVRGYLHARFARARLYGKLQFPNRQAFT